MPYQGQCRSPTGWPPLETSTDTTDGLTVSASVVQDGSSMLHEVTELFPEVGLVLDATGAGVFGAMALQEVSGISAVIAMAAATVRAGRLFLIMARLLEETELWLEGS